MSIRATLTTVLDFGLPSCRLDWGLPDSRLAFQLNDVWILLIDQNDFQLQDADDAYLYAST